MTDWASRVTTYTYDTASRLVRIDRPNGTYCQRVYDSASQLTDIIERTSSGVIIGYEKLKYDNDGRIGSQFLHPKPSPVVIPFDSLRYDDDNRLNLWNSQTVTTDSDGNMTYGPLPSGAFGAYTYDARNRLVTAGGATHRYNPDGLRVATTGTGAATYAVDPNAVLSRTLIRTKGGVATYYVYGLGLIYEEAGSDATQYHFDHVGNTLFMTNASQAVTDRWNYSPYGTVVFRSGGKDTPYQFNGAYGVETDANGLIYMRNRYYNSRLMRFVNADPVGFVGGLNWYAFASNDPMMNADPLGLWSATQSWGVVKAVGGGLEITVGAALGVATSWTGGGAVVGGAVVLHGADTFSSGMRQVFSGEETDTLTSQALQSVGVSRDVANLADASVGIVGSGVAGGAKGLILARSPAKGLEFSHWIPNRWYGPRSVWNGNYVSPSVHALSDPFRYRFMPVLWKASNPMPNFFFQQWVRLPHTIKGVAGGASVAIVAQIDDFVDITKADSKK